MKQIFLFLIFLIACNSYADQTQTRPAPCGSPEFRQFDFWIGEWDVYNAKDKVAGKSKIEIILDECVILENWTGSGGYTGKSFNIYNPSIKKWEQLWVDNQAGVLKMTGEFQNGVLHYTGETPAADGSRVQEDLTFTPLANKEVRQIWKQSTDGGRTWKIVFDGIYKRRK